MADALLRELSNTDLDWLITSGERQRLPSGQQLFDAQNPTDQLHLLIEGCLGLTASQSSDATEEVLQGEFVGLSPLLGVPNDATASTLSESLILSLPIAQVQAKLKADIDFAAHFHRAIAVMLSDRLRRIFESPDRIQLWGERSAKEALSVFGELRDSDIDWLVSFGEIQPINANQVLLQAGRPVDAFYIVLDGQFGLSAPDGNFNALLLCFSGLEESTQNQSTFAQLSRGGLPGIISFLDFRPLPVTVRAVQNATVFAVPRQTLVTKLQVDASFASRFYRVIAIQILELLETICERMAGSGANADLNDDEELDFDDLDQMSEGAKKFNWMLNQLGVNYG
jgi:bacteriocin-type transport-associated protein